MAKKKKAQTALLQNTSRQRRDVILQTSKGVKTVSVLAGRAVPVDMAEASEQLKSMLARPRTYGLRVVETGAVEEAPDASDDKEDDG